jgi:hypothetical protein
VTSRVLPTTIKYHGPPRRRSFWIGWIQASVEFFFRCAAAGASRCEQRTRRCPYWFHEFEPIIVSQRSTRVGHDDPHPRLGVVHDSEYLSVSPTDTASRFLSPSRVRRFFASFHLATHHKTSPLFSFPHHPSSTFAVQTEHKTIRIGPTTQ